MRARLTFHAALSRTVTREAPMLDVILIAAGFAFFAAGILYTVACDKI